LHYAKAYIKIFKENQMKKDLSLEAAKAILRTEVDSSDLGSNVKNILNNSFEGKSVRTFGFKGEVCFIGKDVAELLGYKNSNETISKHCRKPISLDELVRGDYLSILIEAFNLGNNGKKVKVIKQGDVLGLIAKSRKLPTSKKEEIIKHFELGDKIVLESRREIEFIHKFKRVLMPFGWEMETQKRVKNYMVDMYFPDFNIVVEFDENGHNSYNKDDEKKREKVIKKELGCTIIRVDDRDDDLFNIGYILNILTRGKIEYEPSTVIIDEVDQPLNFEIVNTIIEGKGKTDYQIIGSELVEIALTKSTEKNKQYRDAELVNQERICLQSKEEKTNEYQGFINNVKNYSYLLAEEKIFQISQLEKELKEWLDFIDSRNQAKIQTIEKNFELQMVEAKKEYMALAKQKYEVALKVRESNDTNGEEAKFLLKLLGGF